MNSKQKCDNACAEDITDPVHREFYEDSREAWQSALRELPSLETEVATKLLRSIGDNGAVDTDEIPFLISMGSLLGSKEALDFWLVRNWIRAEMPKEVWADEGYCESLVVKLDVQAVTSEEILNFHCFKVSTNQWFVVARNW